MRITFRNFFYIGHLDFHLFTLQRYIKYQCKARMCRLICSNLIFFKPILHIFCIYLDNSILAVL